MDRWLLWWWWLVMYTAVYEFCGEDKSEYGPILSYSVAGEVINERDRCQACLGRKVVQQTKLLEVQVDKGMRDEQRITFHGEGDQMPGVEPGDVIIVLQVSGGVCHTPKSDFPVLKIILIRI